MASASGVGQGPQPTQTVVRAVPAHPCPCPAGRLLTGSIRIGGGTTRHPTAGRLTGGTEAATRSTGRRVKRQLLSGNGRESRNTNGQGDRQQAEGADNG